MFDLEKLEECSSAGRPEGIDSDGGSAEQRDTRSPDDQKASTAMEEGELERRGARRALRKQGAMEIREKGLKPARGQRMLQSWRPCGPRNQARHPARQCMTTRRRAKWKNGFRHRLCEKCLGQRPWNNQPWMCDCSVRAVLWLLTFWVTNPGKQSKEKWPEDGLKTILAKNACAKARWKPPAPHAPMPPDGGL